jgi:DNA-binding response OmpR family regulator
MKVSVLSQKKFEFGTFKVNVRARQVLRRSSEVYLTTAEFDLLIMFLTRAGHIISRKDLLLAMNKPVPRGRLNCVDMQISRLRLKIEDNPQRPQYLKSIRGKGYVFAGAVIEEVGK